VGTNYLVIGIYIVLLPMPLVFVYHRISIQISFTCILIVIRICPHNNTNVKKILFIILFKLVTLHIIVKNGICKLSIQILIDACVHGKGFYEKNCVLIEIIFQSLKRRGLILL